MKEFLSNLLYIPLPSFVSKHLKKIKWFLIVVLVFVLVTSSEDRPRAVREFILNLF